MPSRLLSAQELDRINIRDNLPYGSFDTDILANRFDLQTLSDFGMPDDLLKSLGIPSVLDMMEDPALPALSPAPRSQVGDVYLLGPHRLMCGDSTNPDHVNTLLGGATPILMVTDPPYGVSYDPEWREKGNVGKCAKGKVLNDDRADWTEAYQLFPGDVAYVWHPASTTHLFAQHLEACGFTLITLIIWVKQHFVFSRGDYHHQHELLWYAAGPRKKQKNVSNYTPAHTPLWYACKKGKKHNWQGKRDQTTVWDIPNNNSIGSSCRRTVWSRHAKASCVHAASYPEQFCQRGRRLRPFLRIRTTLMACEQSGRICTAMELSPAYVDMTIARWEKETGKKAILSQNTTLNRTPNTR